MPSADDDYERLLREVEGALGEGGGRQPERVRPATPAPAGKDGAGDDDGRAGPVARVRAGLPVGIAVGAVAGAAVGVVFGVLPFVDSLSGALGAFVGASGVYLAGRVRGRRGR